MYKKFTQILSPGNTPFLKIDVINFDDDDDDDEEEEEEEEEEETFDTHSTPCP